MRNTILLLTFIFFACSALAQNHFTSNPSEAKFVKEDFDRYWKAFDQIDTSSKNPFKTYLRKASKGFKPLVGYLDADVLLQVAKDRRDDYLKSRNVLDNLGLKETEIKTAYAELKSLYPDAKFPPVYFVVGMFTSGGTITDNGLLIGSEMLENLDGIAGLISHELIHYQQRLEGKDNLLKQSILEGSADFIGEMISGKHVNLVPFNYGNEHRDELSREFVKVMLNDDYTDWLYGISGKDNRPNDLGYWMGYKITEAYFKKQKDEKQAIYDILHIKDPMAFLKKSGYLEKFMD